MFTGRLFTIGRLPTALATGPAMAAAIGPVEAVTAPATAAIALEVADTAGVEVIGAAAATAAEYTRGDSAERPTPLVVAPSALALKARARCL